MVAFAKKGAARSDKLRKEKSAVERKSEYAKVQIGGSVVEKKKRKLEVEMEQGAGGAQI